MSEVVELLTLREKRERPRHSAYMFAKMLVPGQDVPTSCIVREISPSGAQIEVKGHSVVPKVFWLQIDGDTKLHLCEVASISEEYLGVDFRPDKRAGWAVQTSESTLQLPNRARL
jgi:hypothetical protein